ncbi:hypothetical protein CYLTODRAFT_398145 [Cylindrobasidium torrendii FP15055 ss-10]|uniref:MFS general substrate transporter n=1 Tax=Cylindrobasidium torrendii FP15055 ss-10 TaxID=1314674 RepID=A0A0D7B9M8_9AGAR|nr:hypothetical protein CYLTODRAFT_398145 [Cylindrobasidium torrendii FP15055 ss-10]
MFSDVWKSYTSTERRNIAIYVAGIMLYKVGLEFFNGSITTLAADRFSEQNTFTKLGAAQGLNQAAQCVGAILIAPFIKRWHVRTVLSAAVMFFALMTMILLVVDATTGGKIRFKTTNNQVHYGNWNPNAIFVIWTLSGVSYGMVELIRRVIPCDIVGGNVGKLRRMDAAVHICYEISGTAAAFASSAAISRLGNNYSFLVTPVFFALAGIVWLTLGAHESRIFATRPSLERVEPNQSYLKMVWGGLCNFVKSTWVGFFIVFGQVKFMWLFPGYALALYLHRFLESTLAPAFSKRVLGISAWSQILVGASNFGELLGAFTVFVFADTIHSPMPWLRLDALMLNLVWLLPFFSTRATHQVVWAWRTGACFIPISFGWAAGDVSLSAYIQSVLSTEQHSDGYPGVSSLGAVMAFLYSSYIVLNAVLSSVLGRVIDRDFSVNKNITRSLKSIGGIQYSVCAGVIMLFTFIHHNVASSEPLFDMRMTRRPEARRDLEDKRFRQTFDTSSQTSV